MSYEHGSFKVGDRVRYYDGREGVIVRELPRHACDDWDIQWDNGRRSTAAACNITQAVPEQKAREEERA